VKIVHVYNWLNPSNGGPPRVIAGIAAAQRGLGHAVSFITSDAAGDAVLDTFLRGYFPQPQALPPRTVVRPKFFRALVTRRRIRAALKGADIVHLHGIWPPVALLVSQQCRALGIPYVLAPHGSLHVGALVEKRLKKLAGMYALGYAGMIKNAGALHALNAEEANGAPRHLLPAHIEVIPNGVLARDFEALPALGRFRESLPALGAAPYVLFLSRLHWGKGCDLLADAFTTVATLRPDVHLVVAGGDQGGKAMFEAGAATGKWTDRLHLVGEIRGARKAEIFRDCACFVLPSRHEGFSIAITEALGWGRPVVISRECHFPEVASEGCGVEVELTPAAIAQGLISTLADPARAEAMGERGRALVLSRYRWSAIAERTIDLYRAVLG
jgi:glycosyltransferase involved in cell wall biosynthesis